MSFIRNSLLTFVGTLARAILALAGQIIIARVLGPAGKGLYAFLVYIPTVLVPLCSLGLNYANTYYVARNREDRQPAAGNAVVLAFLLGGVMSAALAVSYLFLHDSYLKDVTLFQLGLIMAGIPFSLVNLYWLGILWGMDRIGKYNIGLLIQYIVLAAGVSAFAVIGSTGIFPGLTPTGAFGIWTAGNILTTVYLSFQLFQDCGKRWSVSRRYFRQTIGYGLKSYAANVMMVINYRLDVFIITGFLPFAQVGLYTTAVTMAEMVGYVGNAINTALIPKLASGQEELSFSSTPKVVRLTLFLTLVAALGLAILGYPLIVLFFGYSFAGAYIPLLFLLPGVVALGGAIVLNGDLMARGKPVYNSIATGISVVLTVALDFSLIPLWGIHGAAIASSLVYMLLLLINYSFYRKESGEKMIHVMLIHRSDFREIFVYLRQVVRKR